MLVQLTISDFAIISHLEIGFEPGLNILSGETGAGKSIIISAVNLILGGRASADLIRSGANEARVEALFNLPENPFLSEFMSDLGFLYNGELLRYYVHGRNLDRFKSDIMKYKVLVTYNGKCFDIPVINRYFNIRVGRAHIDLRYVLSSLGYKGALKGCEKKLGLRRDGLDGVDGFFAVLLWNDFVENRN